MLRDENTNAIIKLQKPVTSNSKISMTSMRGAFEERLKGVLGDAEKSNGRVVLFIDEMHTLFGAGGGTMDAANMLKPALARGPRDEHAPSIGAARTCCIDRSDSDESRSEWR